jgi:hypothetical protein
MGVHVLAVYVLLQCAQREGQVPTTHQWILDHMPDKTSPNTVTAALRWLTNPERQMAVRVTGGWRLGANAFQLPLGYSLSEGENLAESENRAQRDSGPALKLEEEDISHLNLIDISSSSSKDENRAESENRAQRDSRTPFNVQNLSQSENLPQSENHSLRDSAVWTPEVLDDGTELPSPAAILKETGDLFGRPGVVMSGLVLDVMLSSNVFGWLACAYDQWEKNPEAKGRLHTPGSWVYQRLAANESPSFEYQHNWINVLPENWLERFGLVVYQCEICRQESKLQVEHERHVESHPRCSDCREVFADQSALAEHAKSHHRPSRNTSVNMQIDGQLSAATAWEAVKGQLQMEMPRASFETWVRDTDAVDYDGETLAVGVRNAYARDWLESRVRSTAERLIVGVLKKAVTVQFVTGEGMVTNDEAL